MGGDLRPIFHLHFELLTKERCDSVRVGGVELFSPFRALNGINVINVNSGPPAASISEWRGVKLYHCASLSAGIVTCNLLSICRHVYLANGLSSNVGPMGSLTAVTNGIAGLKNDVYYLIFLLGLFSRSRYNLI